MKSVLILQSEIMEYRKPIYNGLADSYNVVVLHSGKPSVKQGDRYREIITSNVEIWRFHFMPNLSLSKMANKFDAIIAMFDLGWPGFLAPLLWKNRPKYILWGHRYSANGVACAVRDWLMARADRLLMYGDEEVERMISRGISPDKICIAWNTIHVPNHCDFSGVKKNSLLFVGRLQPMKRIDLIIEEFARLQGHIPDATVIDIVGSPADNAPGIESELKRLVDKLKMTRKVFFHGRVDDPNTLAMIFSRAHAYISPSPVGLGVLHSLAYGVPVITFQNVRHGPEFQNLKHGENSLICKDVTELSEAMRAVCNDRELTARLGQSAYRHYVTNRPLKAMLDGIRKAVDG